MPTRYTSRSSRSAKSKGSARRMSSKEGTSGKASRRGGTKGLTADGSTRAWRKARAALPGKPKRCPDGAKPFVDHKVPRRLGGSDSPSNLRWKCGHNPGVGHPRKDAPAARFRPENRGKNGN